MTKTVKKDATKAAEEALQKEIEARNKAHAPNRPHTQLWCLDCETGGGETLHAEGSMEWVMLNAFRKLAEYNFLGINIRVYMKALGPTPERKAEKP